MTIATRRLISIEDLRAAVALQQNTQQHHPVAIWHVPHLRHVHNSGGLLLGVSSANASEVSLDGLLIDLVSKPDEYPAHQTVAWCVSTARQDRGIGTQLRLAERRILREKRVDVVRSELDPLDSKGLHLALNKLGGILTGYTPDCLGSHRDPPTPGLATDCVHWEWWLDAPRVIGILDRGDRHPSHSIGLHEMAVATATTTRPSGVRGIVNWNPNPSASHVLVEIPTDISSMQVRDCEAAIQWRLQSRDAMLWLFSQGYLGVGLIHEGGRSFLLFKIGTRRTELSDVAKH